MEVIDEYAISPLRNFYYNSKMLVNKCHQPDSEEYSRALMGSAAGFVVLGLAGFLIKIVFIPVNNIIMGQ